MSVLSDLGSSITGNIDSAMLIIYDCRKIGDQAAGTFQGIGPKIEAEAKISATAEAVLTNGLAAASLSATDQTQKSFRVQFNPNQLSLDAVVDAVDRIGAQNAAENGREVNAVSDVVVAPRIDLSLTLIFDQVNIYDAFMWDKLTMGVSASGVTNMVSAGMTAAGKKVWSVQKEVEGLVAALRNPFTRKIRFQWADFSFTGSLQNVSAQYEMFSVSGRPIRAKVFLRLRQDQSVGEMQKWKQDFDKIFKNGSASLSTVDQKASSLVNLGMGL